MADTELRIKVSNSGARQTARQVGQLNAQLKGLEGTAGNLNSLFAGLIQGIGQQIATTGLSLLQQSLAATIGVAQVAIGEFERFETALTDFDAKSDASADQIARVGDQAKELAAVTSQTPGSVAELSTALLTLGATADDVETNLEGVTKLADVLREDPVLTGRVVQTGITNFEALGESADSITDKLNTLINTTAAGSAGGIEEFFQFFQDVGPLAGTLDASFDELASGFATLRDSGFSAATGATGLRIALLRLSAPSGEAEQLLSGLARTLDGVDNIAFNNDGTFRGFTETLNNFAEATAGFNQQEQIELAKTIFGDEGAPAILALLGEVDGKYQNTLNNLDQSAGSVNESLDILNQSLERQAELLQGNISGALVTFGEAIAPVKREFVEFANALLSETLESSEGLERLTAAGERLGVALNENPEVVERIGDALADLVDTGVDQLAQLIDAVTAFIANENNIDNIADSIGRVGDAIVTAGRAARFIIALVDGISNLVTFARDLPVVGEQFERVFTSPVPVIEALTTGIRTVIGLYRELRGLTQDAQSLALDETTRRTQEGVDALSSSIESLAQANVGSALTEAGAAALGLTEQTRQQTGELEDQQQSLADLTKAEAERAEAAKKAAAERANALNQARDEEELTAKRALDDELTELKSATDAQIEERQRAAAAGIDTQKEALDERQEAEQDALDERIDAQKALVDEEIELSQRALAAEKDALQESQDARKQALNERQALEREQRNRELSALEREVERRLALEQAQTDAERDQLEERFEAEDEALKRRRELEAQVLRQEGSILANQDLSESPLAAARRQFEEGQQTEQDALELEFKAEDEAIEARELQLADSIKAKRLELEEAVEQQRDELSEQQDSERQALEDSIEQQRLENEATLVAIREQSEDQILQRRRDFEDEQRRLNLENARQVEAILDAAESGSVQSLRVGGVAAGGVVQVHKDEFLIPPKGTRVVSQQASRALVRQSLMAREAGSLMGAPGGLSYALERGTATDVRGVEQRLDALLKAVQQRPRPVAPATVQLGSDATVGDAMAATLAHQREVLRGMGI